MLSISIKHPDARKFISIKNDDTSVTGANISVRIDNDFMEAVKDNKTYTQQYPIDSKEPTHSADINAKELWDEIIDNAWSRAEPGILFWDKVIDESIPDCYADLGFKTVSTNPCFPSSERLLTDKGYETFGDLYKSQCNNNVICDNRISYTPTKDNVEHTENWVINSELTGTSIKEASPVALTAVNQPVFEVELSKGFTVRCTADHHIATTEGMVEAQDLTLEHDILITIPNSNDDSIVGIQPTSTDEIVSTLIGLVTGDGCLSEKKIGAHIDFWGDDRYRMKQFVCDLIDTLHDRIGDLTNSKNKKYSKYYISDIVDIEKVRITSAWLYKVFESYGYSKSTKHVVPSFILNNASSTVGKYYLAAMIYCDGSIQGTKEKGYSVRLSQSNKPLLQQIQLIAHSNGILMGIYKRRDKGESLLPDGKGGNCLYKTKANYELITLKGSFVHYRDKIGVLGDLEKEGKLNVTHKFRVSGSYTDNMVRYEHVSNEDVYCLKEPITRSIVVNGISARRCGEIPLCPYDSCRLLAMNLYSYVDHKFTSKAKFNFELFDTHSKLAIRIMDDIIELEIEKITAILAKIKADPEPDSIKSVEYNLWLKILAKCEEGRRTGVGITAMGDMLAAMGLVYGTPKATKFAEKVHKSLALGVYNSSVSLAKERGSFPIWDSKREVKNPFLNRLFGEDSDLQISMKKYGRRNIACLTIAPTGTTSMMTQTSSGIEPAFKVYYTRRTKINPGDSTSRVDFVDEVGDSWMENNVFHHKFKEWYIIASQCEHIPSLALRALEQASSEELDELIKKSPWHNATANDIDWVEKVNMQGKIQKWIDHSISVTVNIPNEASKDLVSDIYMKGFDVGCKGITVYRDGCRSGVLISKTDKAEKVDSFTETHAPKRPKRLKAQVVRFQNNYDKWIAFVGLLDGKPYEVFTFKAEDSMKVKSDTVGEIIKTKVDGKGKYDFVWGEEIIENINTCVDMEYYNYGKLLSGILRHGMPVNYVIDIIGNLNFKEDHITTWKNGVLRAIKQFIVEGSTSNSLCPDCSSKLVYSEGCLSCKSCGHSKCG